MPRGEWREALLLEQIAGGLMSLRETTRRSLSVVACLRHSWQEIKTQATDTVQDRFREATQLKEIPSAELGRELVEKRFAPLFDGAGVTPPYPSWPVSARRVRGGRRLHPARAAADDRQPRPFVSGDRRGP